MCLSLENNEDRTPTTPPFVHLLPLFWIDTHTQPDKNTVILTLEIYNVIKYRFFFQDCSFTELVE